MGAPIREIGQAALIGASRFPARRRAHRSLEHHEKSGGERRGYPRRGHGAATKGEIPRSARADLRWWVRRLRTAM